MDKAGEDLFAFKPNLPAIEKQERKRNEHRQRMQELERTDFAKQLKIFKDFKINWKWFICNKILNNTNI